MLVTFESWANRWMKWPAADAHDAGLGLASGSHPSGTRRWIDRLSLDYQKMVSAAGGQQLDSSQNPELGAVFACSLVWTF